MKTRKEGGRGQHHQEVGEDVEGVKGEGGGGRKGGHNTTTIRHNNDKKRA